MRRTRAMMRIGTNTATRIITVLSFSSSSRVGVVVGMMIGCVVVVLVVPTVVVVVVSPVIS